MSSQNFIPLTPDLNAWLNLILQNFSAKINCVSIGTINSFDKNTQTATVAINYLRIFKNANPNLPNPATDDQTSDVYLSYPLLIRCPVFVNKGGGAYLTFPIKKGDMGIVLFNDRELDTWLTTGQTSYPRSLRTHDLSDAIILLGISPLTNSIENYNPDVISLTDQSGERLWVSGDTKWSFRIANHSGWLIMDGLTIGNNDSGASYIGDQYEELFNIIKSASPNTGSEVFSDGDTVIIPDMRGRGAIGADNMGGSNANVLTASVTPNRNVLGGDIGEQTHLLTGQESGIQDHTHLIPNSVGGAGPDSISNMPGGKENTSSSGNIDAIDPHNNIPPGMIGYWFIKI